jgi:Protein of unknown function (DUF402)
VGFATGEGVVLHEVWRGRVWAARPMRIVRDDGDFVALWFPTGTRWKAPTDDPSRPWNSDRAERLAACAARGEWSYRDAEWEVNTLSLMHAGDWHALWISWLPSGEHWGWYGNVQEPFHRTERGFQTMDLVLDVVVDADRTWRIKDEEELATFVEQGVFDDALARRVREEGREVVRRLEQNEPPFCDPWPEWRPDPSWVLPELPHGWKDAPGT